MVTYLAKTLFDLEAIRIRYQAGRRAGSGFLTENVSKLDTLPAAPATAAKLGIKVHAHMLRHGCGYALANKGLDTRTLQAYLGHRSINSTTRYAALAPGRFKNIWGRV